MYTAAWYNVMFHPITLALGGLLFITIITVMIGQRVRDARRERRMRARLLRAATTQSTRTHHTR